MYKMSLQLNKLSQKTVKSLVNISNYSLLSKRRNFTQNLKTNFSLNLHLSTLESTSIKNNDFKLQKLSYHQLSKENAVYFTLIIIHN